MDARRFSAVCAAALSLALLAACTPTDVGYVEIKTVPVATPTTTFYLDAVKLEPPKNGTAVLPARRHRQTRNPGRRRPG
jgi:hypothetical protein